MQWCSSHSSPSHWTIHRRHAKKLFHIRWQNKHGQTWRSCIMYVSPESTPSYTKPKPDGFLKSNQISCCMKNCVRASAYTWGLGRRKALMTASKDLIINLSTGDCYGLSKLAKLAHHRSTCSREQTHHRGSEETRHMQAWAISSSTSATHPPVAFILKVTNLPAEMGTNGHLQNQMDKHHKISCCDLVLFISRYFK